MPLITIIVVLIVVGVLLYLANNFLPMDQKVKTILNAVVIIAIVLWLITIFVPGLGNIRVGH